MDLFTLTGGFLVSTAITIPVIFVLSWLTGSMLWGTVGGVVPLLIALTRIKYKRIPFDLSALLLLVFSLTFSAWMMFKTFHGGTSGELFVGSNNIFDFSLATGLMRSMSWGANIPFLSPYFSGLPMFYHFFFSFWTALLEYFRVPAVLAINIPSILSFTALLVMVYYLPQVVAKQKPIVGWIAVALTITNSSLTFWKLLLSRVDFIHLPTYPFAGPYDGSVISIFVTLNSYVNQRHLAFAIALGLYLFMMVRKQNAIILGVITGFMALWNIALFPLITIINASFYLIRKEWKPAVIYALVSIFVGLLWFIPYAGVIVQIPAFLSLYSRGSGGSPQWSLLDYLWQNLGILPVVAGIGLITLHKKLRAIWIPFVVFFILIFLLKHGFEQKSFSFLIIGINALAAIGIGWMWKKAKVLAILLMFVLTISGIVDLVPIKNEFAYPLIGKDTVPVISWMRDNTPKTSVFVSYSDMIDPVVLAGRKNYFGFFGNIGWQDRSADVRNIYAGDITLAKEKGISYVLVPKWQKNDFPYVVDATALSDVYTKAYEDGKFVIFQTDSPRNQADISRPAITVINPIRGNGLGHETDDLAASLKVQSQITKEHGIRGTWLFQYGALENPAMTEYAKREMKGEEFGLLFEIDRNYAEKSSVPFRGQIAWYASDGLFLNSYDLDERQLLIDTAFAKFKEVFGYYPKTVGAWWIGGDSLTYMQQKYGIVAAMRAADQFNLDMYSIWGTPWNIPYLPSKSNEGIPAASFETSSKVVILQWAIRDPLEGYADPMYSLQDYPARGYTAKYVDYMSSIFLQPPFGHLIIGLENGGTRETFGQFYKPMLIKAGELQSTGNAQILTAGEFAKNYLIQKKVFAGKSHFLSTDYDSKNQSFWYISENYRAAVLKTGDDINLVDLRNYADKVPEDFEILSNSQSVLRIQEPAIVDSMRFPDQKIHIQTTKEPLTIQETGNRVDLYAGKEKIAEFFPGELTLYGEIQNGKTYTFIKEREGIRPIYFLLGLYILYFGIRFVFRIKIHTQVRDMTPMLIPLVLAYPLLVQNSTFLFDKKESIFFTILSATRLLPVLEMVYVSKVLPILLLLVFHYLFIVRFPGNAKKIFFWGYYGFVVFMYMHIPYFPLDRTTYAPTAIAFGIIGVILSVIAFFLYKKHKSGKVLVACLVGIPVILGAFLSMVMFSRSRLALTMYEIQAMQMIKDQKKNVIYVEEVDYSVRPIYKAVRPLLYTNYTLGQLMTGTKWQIVMRPENNMLTLSGYDNSLIVIPRYLGTDISGDETASLHLTKIFDNAQIALFEKNK